MPNLVTIFGPPAVGKAAVGHELAQMTGYKLFHNHLTADPVAALFGWGNSRFSQLVDQIRFLLFAEAADAKELSGVIFTFVWALNLPEDKSFIDRIESLFFASGGRSYFVELAADLNTRLEREGTDLRLALKPGKRDVAAARQLLVELEGKYKLNSAGDFFYPERHLMIDTQRLSARQAAHRIVERWQLSPSDAAV